MPLPRAERQATHELPEAISYLVMRIVLNVVGALLVATGCIWILQGINVIPGSFMTGQTKWAMYGLVSLIAGAALLITARRRRNVSRGGE